MKKKKWMMMAVMVLALTMMFGTTVYASGKGDVAGAIEGTWQDASAQIKTVVNKVVFPAIDLAKSGTRHEELLLTPEECEGVAMVRRILSQGRTREATSQLIGMLLKTAKNEEFFKRLREWLAIWEKEGYTIRSSRSGI